MKNYLLKLFQEDNTPEAFRYLLEAVMSYYHSPLDGLLKVMNAGEVIVDKIKAKYFSK
jgi:hypothetical protein